MAIRILAVAAAIAPVIAALGSQWIASSAYVPAAIAAVLGTIVLIVRRKSASLAALGIVLAAIAGIIGARLHGSIATVSAGDPSSWPVHDLTQGPLPDEALGPVAVRGYFRDEWVLDEYGTRQGERPNLDGAARAVLVPLLGTMAETPKLAGRIVIARVVDGREQLEGAETVLGRLEPLPDEILHALVQTATNVPADQVRGVLLDSIGVADRRSVWVDGTMAALCAVIALVCLWVAAGRDDPARS